MDEQVHRRTFRGERAELAAVRRFARQALPPGCPVLADFVLLLDEVAAGAVLHSDSGRPGGAFEVVISHRPGAARAEVRDAGTSRAPERSREAGRCLLLVSVLAREWGSRRLPHGRVVWFEVADHHDRHAA